MNKPTAYSEVVTYWRGVKATLAQRGLLKQQRKLPSGERERVLPAARYQVEQEYVAFILDMHRLAGVSREQWLDADLHAQVRATLQGRRVFVADGAGLALVVARNPDAKRVRLPNRIELTPDLVPDGDYTAMLGVAAGGPVIFDLADGERGILVGGSTGSGKTRTILSLILQVASKNDPDKLALALVDLKQLDFVALAGLPHLVGPVATSEADAVALVSRCVGEMERRQAVMGAASVTRWDRLPEGDRFPLLLVVVDEVADFADSAVMGDLVKLARKGRASGISLILATQRPDAVVLSRQAKANVSTRLAFRVTDATESRIILDRAGAERIKRTGLALCNAGGTWRKVQCAFVPDGAAGDWVTVAPKISTLSDAEVSLVRYAVETMGGAFTVNTLYTESLLGRVFGDNGEQLSKYALTKLAQKWERCGWLTQQESRTSPRRVTRELAALAGCTGGVENRDAVMHVIQRDTPLQGAQERDTDRDTTIPAFLRPRLVDVAGQGGAISSNDRSV